MISYERTTLDSNNLLGEIPLPRCAAHLPIVLRFRRMLENVIPRLLGWVPISLRRALIGHPELSTRNELLISFFNPGDNHVEVSAYPW